MTQKNGTMYQKGKIYRMTCGDLTYIGSTCQPLCERKARHHSQYKQWIEGKKHYITSFDLFKIGNPEITLIEDFPCDRKEQLLQRERHYIETLTCVNKMIPGRTRKEEYSDNVEYYRNKSRRYHDQHKDERHEYFKQRNIKLGSFQCLCGSNVKVLGKVEHEKTKKHQKFINSTIYIDSLNIKEKISSIINETFKTDKS
jgi:hypothetical protein